MKPRSPRQRVTQQRGAEHQPGDDFADRAGLADPAQRLVGQASGEDDDGQLKQRREKDIFGLMHKSLP
jgi:hypothetical protein